jgi:hypothetical protein
VVFAVRKIRGAVMMISNVSGSSAPVGRYITSLRELAARSQGLDRVTRHTHRNPCSQTKPA